ncbi:hypothetical protein GCM10028804_59230 [Larkinella terrae]
MDINPNVDPKIERLKQLRELKGLNPNQFARLLEISGPNYYQIESGQRKLGKNISIAIAYRLGLNPNWWETGEGPIFLKEEKGEIENYDLLLNLHKRIAELEMDKEFLQAQIRSQNETIRILQAAVTGSKPNFG